MPLRPRSLLPLTLALALVSPTRLGLTPVPLAHADETTRARTLFQEGLQLETGGNFAAALGKFQEVAQVRRTPQVVFHIALCQEKLGQLVAALGGYRIVVHDGAGDAKNNQVVQTAQDAITSLEKRVPTLTVKRGKGADLAHITLDGVELGGSLVGKPQQLDPGPHSLEATESGHLPYKEVVQIAEGEAKVVEISLKEKPGDKPPPPPPPTTTTDPSSSVALPPPTVTRSTLPYVVLGAGAASLVASGVFYYLRSSALDDLDSSCRGNVCPESSRSASDRGKTMTLLGNITLGVGLVGVGVGTVLLFTSKPKEQPAAAARARSLDLVLQPGPRSAGATLIGTF